MTATKTPTKTMTRRRWIGSFAAVLVLAAAALVLIDRYQLGRVAPALVAPADQADFVLVEKAARRLTLLRDGRVLAVYPVSLGFTPVGAKRQEGDGRTPEGRYTIAYRNPLSVAHLSLKISYPDAEQERAAAAAGYPAGGDIMIHGIFNGFSWLGPLHRFLDWTNGCVAVTNPEMEAIYARVDVGTPVEIRP